MIIGKYNNVLDDKHRIRINPAFKPDFIGKLVLVMSVNGCVSVYSEEGFKGMIGSYLNVGTFDAVAQRGLTSLLSTAFETVTDGQDRIRIPEHLCKYAGIIEEKDGKAVVNKEITTVGKIDHLEIWSTARLESFNSATNFEETFARLNEFYEKRQGR